MNPSILPISELIQQTKYEEKLFRENQGDIERQPVEIWKGQTAKDRLKKEKDNIMKRLAKFYTVINEHDYE